VPPRFPHRDLESGTVPSFISLHARALRLAIGLSGLLAGGIVSGSGTAGAADGGPGRTTDAPALRAVVRTIGRNYVDPTRVEPQKMLWAAAAALDREIPEVLLESAPGDASLTLQVAGASRSFDAASVRTLGALVETLREILRFVAANRRPPVEVASAPEYAAIDGLLSTLDPHSTFLDPAEARDFASQISNQISGVGMVIDAYTSPPSVKAVLKGGSAGEAGVTACDRIVAVEGRSAAGVPIDDLVDRIVGPTGTEVWITFERDGLPRELVLARRLLDLQSVTSRLLEDGVGFIRIDHFSQRTAREALAAVADLRKAGATAWVLDLRANPGGLVREALAAASIFISAGPLITFEGDGGRAREVEGAMPPPGGSEAGPVAVLIAPDTASAAEVLAAALQNRNRAVVLGRTSFGKGSVQQLFDEEDGSRLKLTTALYLTPGGASLQSRGVVPDIELVPVPAPQPGRIRLSESEIEREAELGLAFAARVAARRPDLSLQYLSVLPEHEEEVEIARGFLVATRAPTRSGALSRSRAFVDERRGQEEARIIRILDEAGVDWTAGAAAEGPKVSIHCAQSGAPGKEGRVTVDCDVKNEGKTDAYRVMGRAPYEVLDLTDEEIVVGKVAAGTSRRVTIQGGLASDPAARVTYVPFAFSEQNGGHVDGAPLRVEVPGRPRPPSGDGPAPPQIRITGDVHETTDAVFAVRAAVADRVEVLGAWIRVSNAQAKIDRKKVAYVGGLGPTLDVASAVPLSPGLNQIEVCARGKAAQVCETAFVFRRPSDRS
jgi:carboxyl-terminal processing protease